MVTLFLVAAGGRRVRPVLRHQGEAELGAGAGGCADTAGRCHEVGISQSQLSISVTMDQSGASTRWRRGTCGSPGRRRTWPAASPSSRRSLRRCGWLPLVRYSDVDAGAGDAAVQGERGGGDDGPDHDPGPVPHHPDPRVREEQAEGAVRRALPEVGQQYTQALAILTPFCCGFAFTVPFPIF